MRIDPKYFNIFMATIAIAVAAAIVIYTVTSSSSERRNFIRFVTESDSLRYESWPEAGTGDSLRVSDYGGQFVVVDFWSTRNIYGEERHAELAALAERYGGSLRVMAAAVRDDSQAVLDYRSEHEYPFIYVNGNRIFNRYRVPGIPTTLLFDRSGDLHTVFVGYRGGEADSLERVIRHEP